MLQSQNKHLVRGYPIFLDKINVSLQFLLMNPKNCYIKTDVSCHPSIFIGLRIVLAFFVGSGLVFFLGFSFLAPFALYSQQFGIRICHFAWYLLHFGMVILHFDWYLLHFGMATLQVVWYLLHLAMFAFHFAWYLPPFGTSNVSGGFLKRFFTVSVGFHVGFLHTTPSTLHHQTHHLHNTISTTSPTQPHQHDLINTSPSTLHHLHNTIYTTTSTQHHLHNIIKHTIINTTPSPQHHQHNLKNKTS